MKLLIQLVREILHLSGKSQGISNTYGCGNHAKTRSLKYNYLLCYNISCGRRDRDVAKINVKQIHLVSVSFMKHFSLRKLCYYMYRDF